MLILRLIYVYNVLLDHQDVVMQQHWLDVKLGIIQLVMLILLLHVLNVV